ncbi:MAG: type II secretion system protein [Methylococcaceae bacterium]
MTPHKSHGGFTLIELVMVMVIVGILASLTTQLITLPVKSYLDLQRRTTLVDTADSALRHIQRDIRQALPNSVRITGGGSVIELLHTIDGGRYRKASATSNGSTPLPPDAGCGSLTADVLNIPFSDDCFEVMGTLSTFKPTDTPMYLVVFNTGDSAGNAYTGNNLATLTPSTNPKIIKFISFAFPLASPNQHFFIVDTSITYACINKQLLRYDFYAITENQPDPPTAVTGQVQADKIASCQFTYAPGTTARSGLVTLEMTLTDETGESVQLLHQVHVDNLP